MHTLYAHELHKLNERQVLREAERARFVNRVVRIQRRARTHRSQVASRAS